MRPVAVSLSLALFVLICLSGCAILKLPDAEDALRALPRADREFRAAWVATVVNIDWPSAPGLSTEDQQREARAILDSAAILHLNAIILQVRPHCDAMYASQLEPWSYYLTGVQGKLPDPYYDPLAFWIEEAHNRGIELHAWFNPYRAHLPRGGELSDSSIVRKRPGLAKELRNGTYWLDPTKRETQDHSFNVVIDVVRRYDIDGVHFDDYFYPYGDGNFPDDDTWMEYLKEGGSLSREDWRRDNVNAFIQRVYRGIKKEKPYVKFGISPFGIWRPGYPPSISGFDQYNGLYADARLWLKKGWIDYWTPQLYWPIKQVPQSYPVLLGWWVKENVNERNMWPGMFTSRFDSLSGGDEIINQIMVARGFVPGGPGHIHFSMKALMKDSSALVQGLKKGPYRTQALVPSAPWLDDDAPRAPFVETSMVNDSIFVSWSHERTDDVFRWIVYHQYNGHWEYAILNRNDRRLVIPISRTVQEPQRRRRPQETVAERVERLTRIAVSAVDRAGNESELTYQSIGPQTVQGER
ncbi:MAG: hypothetical protein FJ217_04525 [Ignavibacteria bacterium]|nr:hypothetical protein [Ignavibacteria bacterium]